MLAWPIGHLSFKSSNCNRFSTSVVEKMHLSLWQPLRVRHVRFCRHKNCVGPLHKNSSSGRYSNSISFKFWSDNLRSCPSPVVDFSRNITCTPNSTVFNFSTFLRPCLNGEGISLYKRSQLSTYKNYNSCRTKSNK